MEKILILGHGGHAKSLIDVIERQGMYEIAGYIVNDIIIEQKEEEYPIIGCDKDLQSLYEKGIKNAAMGIGYLGKGFVRSRLYNELKRIGYQFPIIADPTATISNRTYIGEGTFVGKGSIINRDVKVGKMCIINTGTIIEHDCVVSDFSHIAVGAVLCGGVSVGSETLIGANATIIQGRTVGSKCIVGAGEVVRKNVYNEGK